jgi:hypothetical protein
VSHCLTVIFLLLGIVLSPLRAVAATIPVLAAYDEAATTVLGRHDAVRSGPAEVEGRGIYDYGGARLAYDEASNAHVDAGAGAVHAYDAALEHTDQRERGGEGAICGAAAAPTAAKGGGGGTGSSTGGRNYSPSPKHGPGGWGTPMDLGDAEAQEVLNNGTQSGKQIYGFSQRTGSVYEFQPDNVGGYHGYPIPGNEAPPSVLKGWRDIGTITNAIYKQLLRGG